MVKHKSTDKDSPKVDHILHKTIMNSKDKFKKEIARPLSDMLQTCTIEQLEQLIEPSKNLSHQGQFQLAFPKLERLIYPSNEDRGSITPKEFCSSIEKLFNSSVYIDKVSCKGQFLNFNVHQSEYLKQTLASILDAKNQYGTAAKREDKVLIDFSSPNITKPDTDHLRSTLLGHFVRSIYQSQGYSTIATNYFGDWREQYGYLAVGLKKYNDIDNYQQDPVKTLRQVYTRITQDAKNDEKITMAAQEEQDKLDKGQHTQQEQWLDFRTQTLNQYKQIYQRLGISFDSYCGEGELHPIAVPTVIATLRKLHLVIDEESISYVDLSAYPYDANDSLGKAVLLYNDGTFTFLAREIACLLYRLDKYNNLNKVVYVAGIEQERHFKQAFKIVQLILLDQTLPEFEHVSFGKIEGLPKHQQGFDYFLDTGKENMIKTMKEDLRNGKYQDLLECGIQTDDDAQLEGEDAVAYIADQLSISATIIQDMSAKRSRGYHFNWHRITDARGDSGVFLQYTHARICGIQRKMDFNQTPPSYRPSLLRESVAFDLMYTASLYPDVLQNAFQTLDPCPLVLYLFRLAHLISLANYSLRVKDVEKRLSEARLCLFEAARLTLENGMRILGLKPLERM